MGICGSTSAGKDDMTIAVEKATREAHTREAERIKLLLLAPNTTMRLVSNILVPSLRQGAGESGKSTVFKQMKILHGAGFSEQDRREMKPTIIGNILSSIKTLVEKAPELGHEVDASEEAEQVTDLDVGSAPQLDAPLADAITTLWSDAGIQATYADRAKFQLTDSAKYYLDKVQELADPEYIPSRQDVLRARVRTSGIVQEQFEIEKVTFSIYDVGGQRNERRKWIHCFDSVTAIIFVAAISEYDQVLFEDANVNRIDEAIQLFEEVYANPWFENVAFVLFLNKVDLFTEKLALVDIKKEADEEDINGRFLDYTGGRLEEGLDELEYERVLEQAKDYMAGLFLASVQEDRPTYHHFTTATDTENVKRVFQAVRDICLREAVNGSGFM